MAGYRRPQDCEEAKTTIWKEINGTPFFKAAWSGLCDRRFGEQQKLMAGRPVRVIVDAGANIGNTTAVHRDLFPEAQLYAFEPYPPTFAELVCRFEGNYRVQPVNATVRAARGVGSLYANEYVDTNSLLPRPGSSRRYWAADNLPADVVPVDIISLDEFAREHELDHIDILKLDIQGGEGQALKGAYDLLLHHRIDLIPMEVFFVPHYEGALSFHGLTTFLSDFGYSLYNITTW